MRPSGIDGSNSIPLLTPPTGVRCFENVELGNARSIQSRGWRKDADVNGAIFAIDTVVEDDRQKFVPAVLRTIYVASENCAIPDGDSDIQVLYNAIFDDGPWVGVSSAQQLRIPSSKYC
jgi:hypothetical protein